MQLIRVEEDLKEQLDCDFIMVIDTEGLKAPEISAASSGRATGQRASSAYYHTCVSQHKLIGPSPIRRH